MCVEVINGMADTIAKLEEELAELKRHGKWLVTDAYPHRVYCSECFKTFAQEHWEVWQDGSLPRRYCPHCGAKMDGGRDEDSENSTR